MGMNVSINGRPVRNPVVRVLTILLFLQVLIVAGVIAAAVLIPLVGLVVAVGVVGVGALLLSAPLRRRFRRAPSPAATLDENDRAARAKPVERL